MFNITNITQQAISSIGGINDIPLATELPDNISPISGIEVDNDEIAHSPISPNSGTRQQLLALRIMEISTSEIKEFYKQKQIELLNKYYNGRRKNQLTDEELKNLQISLNDICFGWGVDDDNGNIIPNSQNPYQLHSHNDGDLVEGRICLCGKVLSGKKYYTGTNIRSGRSVFLGKDCARYIAGPMGSEEREKLTRRRQQTAELEERTRDIINRLNGPDVLPINDMDAYTEAVHMLYYQSQYEDNPKGLRELLVSGRRRSDGEKRAINRALDLLAKCSITGCNRRKGFWSDRNRYNNYCTRHNNLRPRCPTVGCNRKCDYKKRYGHLREGFFEKSCSNWNCQNR